MKLKLLLYLLLIYIISFCCHQKKPDNKSLEIINLDEAFENRKPINICDISKHIEYIRLESNDKCLTGTKLKVYSSNQFLIAIDRNKILVFNRKDGKFIREIGHLGNGPGEYSRTYPVMPFDEEKNIVYAGRSKKRYGYSIDGHLKDTLTIPELVSEIGNIDEDIYAAYLPNYQGNEKNKIVIFNNKDSIIKIFPNYLSAPITDGFFVWNPGSWFYRLNKQLYFYELFNDTVFHVNSNSLAPRFIFNMGPYSPPYEMKTSLKFEVDKYFIIKTLNESSKYLFCSFNFNKRNFTAIYDKNQRKTLINDYSSETGNGFINNINNFVPPELSSINLKEELICIIDAYRIKKWFEVNPEKINQLPEYLKDLKNIKETDNPIILIAKLKE
jgi:hypothetical protein